MPWIFQTGTLYGPGSYAIDGIKAGLLYATVGSNQYGGHILANWGSVSDIDIFVETEKREIKKELELINSRLSIKIGKYDKKNLLIKEIEKNHVIIKGGELFYEKFEFPFNRIYVNYYVRSFCKCIFNCF